MAGFLFCSRCRHRAPIGGDSSACPRCGDGMTRIMVDARGHGRSAPEGWPQACESCGDPLTPILVNDSGRLYEESQKDEARRFRARAAAVLALVAVGLAVWLVLFR